MESDHPATLLSLLTIQYWTARIMDLDIIMSFSFYRMMPIGGILIFGSFDRQVVNILIVGFSEHQQCNANLKKKVFRRQ